jgi:flagellar hook-length control protein FliK
MKVSSDAPQDVTPKAVPRVDANQSGDSALSDRGNAAQNGKPLPNQAAPEATDRKAGNAEVPSSVDQILNANTTPAQGQQTATNQVRDGVVNALSGNATDGGTSTAPPAASNHAVAAPVLRTLDLTLSPPDLGSVTLHLSLKSNSLSIEAEASKTSTAKLLSDDRTNLERGLRDAGYDVSSVKITDVSASNSSTASGWQPGGSQPRDGEQARPGFGGRQDGEMQRRDGSMSDQSQRRQREENPQQTGEAATGRLASAVYI